jgi:hypothetical protein
MKTDYYGLPFKVINEATGEKVREFSTLQEAQAYADERRASDTAHYQIVEVRWCGGTKRLSDVVREAGIE